MPTSHEPTQAMKTKTTKKTNKGGSRILVRGVHMPDGNSQEAQSLYVRQCIIGQSSWYDFWRAYSLFVARVASFAPERSEGANYATRDTNKLCARQKSFDYHYYQYTRPNCCLSPRKKLIFLVEIKSPTLQNYKVSKYKFAPSLAFKWYPQGSSAKLFDISATNQNQGGKPFAALAFLVWPARTRVLRRAVCHLAARIDNNTCLKQGKGCSVINL